ncbi:MAG: GNAT family N-acetyltransferase [Clostridia bacterium]|nr:GNAT family N-acetyltransferase [Clostridia bacterium]
MMKIGFREIEYGSEEYRQELKMRDRILRKPLGLNLFDEDLVGEAHDFHLGAFTEDGLAGVLVLTAKDSKTLKMRQVAVDAQLQGMGIGRGLVEFAEAFASLLGYGRIEMNARETAVDFYLRLGYAVCSERFIEVTIPHFKMEKKISD